MEMDSTSMNMDGSPAAKVAVLDLPLENVARIFTNKNARFLVPGDFFAISGDFVVMVRASERLSFGKLAGFGIRETSDEAIVGVRAYLSFVLNGPHGNGKPSYCPFVEKVERLNGYHVSVYRNSDGAKLGEITAELLSNYQKISGLIGIAAAGNYAVLIGAFSHPSAKEKEFCEKLEQLHAQRKGEFREKGLMLGVMHPHHPPGGRNGGTAPMFISPVPIMVVRKMHVSDSVFMQTAKDRAVHARLFDKLSACPYAQGTGFVP